jgi:hypothetical protein
MDGFSVMLVREGGFGSALLGLLSADVLLES